MKQQSNNLNPQVSNERFNSITHLVGLCLVPCISWVIIWFGYTKSWQHAFGVTFFTVGMLFMYLASFLYHLWRPGKVKHIMRIIDHIGIYIMIASSYTPICMDLVTQGHPISGWVFFGVIWAIVLLGIIYKVFFFGRSPKLSLLLYVIMGWSVLFIIKPVWEESTPLTLSLILAEGISYTAGVYYFANDLKNRNFHGIWHLFVLLGTLFHWGAVLVMTWPK